MDQKISINSVYSFCYKKPWQYKRTECYHFVKSTNESKHNGSSSYLQYNSSVDIFYD